MNRKLVFWGVSATAVQLAVAYGLSRTPRTAALARRAHREATAVVDTVKAA